MGDDRKEGNWDAVWIAYAQHRAQEANARTPEERKKVRDGRVGLFGPLEIANPGDGERPTDEISCRCLPFVADTVEDYANLPIAPLQAALAAFTKYGLNLNVNEDWSSGKPKFDLKIVGVVPVELTVPPET